jgi:putative PEP-CTERM system histidine kinase
MMDTNEIGAFGYTVALTVYAMLTIVLLSGWRGRDRSRWLTLATSISLLWAGVWTAGFLGLMHSHAFVAAAEWARGLAWLIAAVAILREIKQSQLVHRLRPAYGSFVLLLAAAPAGYFLFVSDQPFSTIAWIAGGYILSLLIILVVEQLYRNAPVDSRSGITYLCIAIAGMFLFDLIINGLVIAGVSAGPGYWASRGFVNAILAVPLALGAWRRAHMSPPAAQVPRQIGIYSFGVTIIAVYVSLIVAGHHFVTTYGGSWSEVGGIVLLVAAVVFGVVLMASTRIRARVRVFLMKTFLQYKYDYRKEWLRFISTLSKSGLEDVGTTAVRAVAQIVNSPGGVVWTWEHESNAYLPTGSWRCAIPSMAPIFADSELARFLNDRQWVIDLEEMKQHPERYEGLDLDTWLQGDSNWWLVVPLFLGKRLYGFIALLKLRTVPSLNFEDHDLLKTAGSHVGMHINQAEADKRLAESRQFGAYNRLTAFLMHDLNNLLAQQLLVVKNAERFRDDPKFVDDAIETIAHSVSRMTRLMEQLSSGSKVPQRQPVDLREAVTQAANRCDAANPLPTIQVGTAPLRVLADMERLTTVFEHLIRNAQDATDTDGEIEVRAEFSDGTVIVSIRDTGKGMTPDFVRERLFRPFDSTKGSQSMGIGVYQARDYVRTLGGQMEVLSVPDHGTTFTIRLPTID